MANEDKTNLQHYIEIVQKVARVEHRRIPSHMVEYEELLSIGIIAIQVMIKKQKHLNNWQSIIQHILQQLCVGRFVTN